MDQDDIKISPTLFSNTGSIPDAGTALYVDVEKPATISPPET